MAGREACVDGPGPGDWPRNWFYQALLAREWDRALSCLLNQSLESSWCRDCAHLVDAIIRQAMRVLRAALGCLMKIDPVHQLLFDLLFVIRPLMEA